MSRLLIWAARALLPFALLIALVLRPRTLLEPWEIVRVARLMWDDPL